MSLFEENIRLQTVIKDLQNRNRKLFDENKELQNTLALQKRTKKNAYVARYHQNRDKSFSPKHNQNRNVINNTPGNKGDFNKPRKWRLSSTKSGIDTSPFKKELNKYEPENLDICMEVEKELKESESENLDISMEVKKELNESESENLDICTKLKKELNESESENLDICMES